VGQALYCLPGKIGARPALGVSDQNEKPAYRCVALSATSGPPWAAKLTIFASYC
jgi:hypothetical protein